ncbi:hypothetical protein KR093_004818 [Drosophila rubida]|uniref:Uncharacterized protein n=1 Tax=Drosophila rubida TaxID=30044 RepID=A0AAD4JR96_9MUSC|nr:hypothetical protein KR093_004818 [Drosophila rubida]
MNGTRKFKSLRVVRFGDILYDQQRRLILLCRSCKHHFLSLEAFQSHLNKCIGVKHIVTSIDQLEYDEDMRETRLVNGQQELFIYEPQAIRKSSDRKIDWEAELEDPRWYTEDSSRTLPYKAKQSPAKENVSKVRTRFQTSNEAQKDRDAGQTHQEPDNDTSPVPAKRIRQTTPRRPILTNQQQSKPSSLDLPAVSSKTKTPNMEDLQQLHASEPTTTLTTQTPAVAALPMVAIPVANVTNNGDTQQILNKLRACGVEVKRRNTREIFESEADAAAIAKKQQALEIMRKLQSNGIKCTKVNKQ